MEHEHQYEDEHNCKCAGCERGIDELMEMQKEKLEKYGWIVHGVLSETGLGVNNIHTHGLEVSQNHIDLEIANLPFIDLETLHTLLANAVGLIKKGVKLEVGKKYDQIMKEPFQVEFINSKEEGRNVLRMILPDKNNCTIKSEMDEFLRPQWELPPEENKASFASV